MSYTGWTTSDYITVASGLVTATPLTLAGWTYFTAIGSSGDLVSLSNTGSAFDRNCFRLALNGSGAAAARTCGSGSGTSANSSTTTSANTWAHVAGVFNSPTSYSAFLDGGGKGTSTTSQTPSGINCATIGACRGTTVNSPVTGRVAEIGIWNAALDDAEIASLAAGMPPPLVRPQSLVAYIPLVASVLDYKGNAFSITGSLSVASHARIYGLSA